MRYSYAPLCLQVLVGRLRLELLTAKIIWLCRQLSEHAVFRTEAFTCTSFYCDTSLPSTSRQQLLQITFTVSFLDVTQKAEGVNEHQPQVIRKLPHNFLYPFG